LPLAKATLLDIADDVGMKVVIRWPGRRGSQALELIGPMTRPRSSRRMQPIVARRALAGFHKAWCAGEVCGSLPE
jgi:hypothetical protein